MSLEDQSSYSASTLSPLVKIQEYFDGTKLLSGCRTLIQKLAFNGVDLLFIYVILISLIYFINQLRHFHYLYMKIYAISMKTKAEKLMDSRKREYPHAASFPGSGKNVGRQTAWLE